MKKEISQIIEKYCKEILDKYKEYIKSIWVYGSATKGKLKKGSDIDIMVILDDESRSIDDVTAFMINNFSKDLANKYRKVDFHPQPPRRLSDFWDLFKSGEPWLITSLKDVIAIYDPSNLLAIVKILLKDELTVASESQILLQRAVTSLESAKKMFLEELSYNLFNSMADVSKVTLMQINVFVPSNLVIGDLLKEYFCTKKMLDENYVDFFEEFQNFQQQVAKGEISLVDGKRLQKYIKSTRSFIKVMIRLFNKLETEKKKSIIKTAYSEIFDFFKKTVKAKSDKNAIEIINKSLVKEGIATRNYVNLMKKINTYDLYSYLTHAKNFRKMLEEKEIG